MEKKLIALISLSILALMSHMGRKVKIMATIIITEEKVRLAIQYWFNKYCIYSLEIKSVKTT